MVLSKAKRLVDFHTLEPITDCILKYFKPGSMYLVEDSHSDLWKVPRTKNIHYNKVKNLHLNKVIVSTAFHLDRKCRSYKVS
jgi:hypothetical protein